MLFILLYIYELPETKNDEIMIIIPDELKDIIKNSVRVRCNIGEQGWYHAQSEEDTLVGDLLGNLRTGKTPIYTDGKIYEWEILYKKFAGRGKDAYESKSGADGIITYEVSDETSEIKTSKSIIFQAKKGKSNQDLEEQKKKMKIVAEKGNFVMRLTSDGYFASQENIQSKKLSDFLADDFIDCKTGIEGMIFDPIRKELRFDSISFINYEIDHRLLISVRFLDDFS